MDRILKILKKENAPRASSAPALELNTIIFKHVYGYMQQISGERLQDHWSSGYYYLFYLFIFFFFFFAAAAAATDSLLTLLSCQYHFTDPHCSYCTFFCRLH